MTTIGSSAIEVMERLLDATNRHDLDRLVGCFAPDFVNETPAHPARSFVGSEQVRRNWAQIFAGVPDLEAEILRRSVDGATVWTEWEMRGTRVDGSPHLMRGVGIFSAEDGRFSSLRFYLEPVERGGAGIDEAVREHITR
jgi:limonene-1,2-epoxide hydrolase